MDSYMSKDSSTGQLLSGIVIVLFILLLIIENSDFADAFHSTLKVGTWIMWGVILIFWVVRSRNKKSED
jgi:hypothetical protein